MISKQFSKQKERSYKNYILAIWPEKGQTLSTKNHPKLKEKNYNNKKDDETEVQEEQKQITCMFAL